MLRFGEKGGLRAQFRSRLEAAFGQYPGGLDLLHRLLGNVRNSLVHGLHSIFLLGAILMGAGLLVNLLLRDVPLRGHPSAPEEPRLPMTRLLWNRTKAQPRATRNCSRCPPFPKLTLCPTGIRAFSRETMWWLSGQAAARRRLSEVPKGRNTEATVP